MRIRCIWCGSVNSISAASDWTCRILVGGLKPSRVYWYRFTDSEGFGSRIGRTITAPAPDDARPVRLVFVSCQNANDGAQNAYRRMIFEDERAAEADRIGFVLHLGDFIYEIVWYPEDRPQGMYDRRIRDIVRYPYGEKIRDFHIPTTVDDYRAVYRAYLSDPDLQDARARWPFVNMWDNHEFSWMGWQSLQRFGGKNLPAQTRKVAANQAFFEYRPARISKPSGPSLERFDPPRVVDTPVTRFDEHGLGQEPNNLAAIGSLKGYRAMRWGRNVELIVTDQRTYRSEEPTDRPEAQALSSDDFPEFISEEAMEILDAGRTYNGGRPPDSIRIGGTEIANFCKDCPPQTILGAEQKAWFLQRLRDSKATWKIWGNTTATLDHARRLAELADGNHQAVVRTWLRHFTARRPRHSIRRARRDLRFRAGKRNHRIRHRGWRPPQLLVSLAAKAPPAKAIRAGWDCLCDWFNLSSRNHRSSGTLASQGPSAAIALCWAGARRSHSAAHTEHAHSPRRALVSRVCA